jgi:hypothetical protein
MEGKEIYQSDKQDSDTQKQRGEIHPPFLTDSGKKTVSFLCEELIASYSYSPNLPFLLEILEWTHLSIEPSFQNLKGDYDRLFWQSS